MAQINEEGLLTSGSMFGRYQIVRHIGSGGMGAVYEATHVEIKKRVALKTLLPTMAANSEARTRFLREAEASVRIDHPHIANVTDVGVANGMPFLVMEFLQGGDLARLIAREGLLSIERTVDIMLPVCS